jgi:hypothetical protein
MLSNSLVYRRCTARPGSFIGLMALYESNFVRFSALVPALERVSGWHVSRVADDCSAYLAVEERSRFTTTVRLTYLFREEGEAACVADPDFAIRVYHDAQQVEAMRCRHQHRHAALRRMEAEASLELDRRWRRNLLLNKWLEYLLDTGHLFSGLRAQQLVVAPAEICSPSRFEG